MPQFVLYPRLALATTLLAAGAACSGNTATSPTSTPTTTTATAGSTSIASVVSSRYKSAVTVAVGGTSIVLRSRGVPDPRHAVLGYGQCNV